MSSFDGRKMFLNECTHDFCHQVQATARIYHHGVKHCYFNFHGPYVGDSDNFLESCRNFYSNGFGRICFHSHKYRVDLISRINGAVDIDVLDSDNSIFYVSSENQEWKPVQIKGLNEALHYYWRCLKAAEAGLNFDTDEVPEDSDAWDEFFEDSKELEGFLGIRSRLNSRFLITDENTGGKTYLFTFIYS